MQTLSHQQMLAAAEEMPLPELEQFVSQLLALSARRKAPVLPPGESELLQKISRGLPLHIQTRCDTLNAKRRAGTLTDEEHAELLKLNEMIENMEAERAGYLAELAQLRGTTLSKLLVDLGITAPAYA
jgi:hypothetical protein